MLYTLYIIYAREREDGGMGRMGLMGEMRKEGLTYRPRVLNNLDNGEYQ